MARFDISEFGKAISSANDGTYEVRKNADGSYTLVPGTGGGSDVRPIIEQAKTRILAGYTDRDPITRVTVGTRSALETRRYTLPGTMGTILETFDRPDGNILTRRFYEGQYLTDLMAANNIQGNALIRTYDRTGTTGTSDEWRFGFIEELTLILTENGLLEIDPSNSMLASLTENGLLTVQQGYELTENGLLRLIPTDGG